MSEGGSGVNSTRWKKIYQIDIETLQIIAEFPNTRRAGKAIGDYGSNLRKCCMGQQRTAGGYYWCYVDQYTPDWRPPIKVDRKKDICQIDMKTLQIIKKWHGAVEAADKLHIQEGHITACCKRKKHSIGGFYWCYAIDYSSDWKPIGVRLSQKRKVRCIETNQEFESIAAAAAQMNISKSDICECCKKRQKHTKGYHWEYVKGEKGHD